MANLLERASIVLTPTAYNNGEALCIKPDDGSGDFDFSRATEATRINSLGLIETIGINLPRINYEAGCGSWLFEPQSTNLFSDSTITTANGGGVVTVNAAISPDGTQNASLINFATAVNDGGRLKIGGSAATPSTDYVISFYAKSVVGDGTFTLRVDTDTQSLLVNINLAATSEWVRYTHTFTTDASASSFGSSSRLKKSSTDNNEILFYGMQLEVGFATSYIPTDGSTVTRNQDLCNNGGSLATINSTEGVLYAEIAALSDDGTTRYISLSDGSNANDIRLYFNTNGNISVLSKVGGSTQSFINSNAYTQTDFNKVAFKYKENDFALWINGVEAGTDTSGITATTGTLNELAFFGNNLPFYGKTKCLAVWKEALTDAELTSLTTI
jgi:hypothetical protein